MPMPDPDILIVSEHSFQEEGWEKVATFDHLEHAERMAKDLKELKKEDYNEDWEMRIVSKVHYTYTVYNRKKPETENE